MRPRRKGIFATALETAMRAEAGMQQLESKGLIVHTSGGVSKGGGFGGLLERSGAVGNELLFPCW